MENIERIFGFDLSFETINLVHGSGLVIASRDEKLLWVEKLEAQHSE